MQFRALPPELYEQCVIFLEEKMYAQAITILQSLVTPSNPVPALASATISSLIATISVHPSTSSRSASSDQQLIPARALSYLSRINAITDSSSAGFVEAFLFKRAHDSSVYKTLSTHGSGRKRRKVSSTGTIDLTHSSSSAASSETTSPVSARSEGAARLDNALAGHSSIFRAAEGFWHVVGWAFNCSIHHPQRWTYYRNWLRLMLEILHCELDPKNSASANPANLGRLYVREADASTRAGLRKILRAIFADGTDTSLAEFHEIWPNETKPPKEKDAKDMRWARNKVNLDEGNFGDYWDDDMEDDMAADMMMKHEGVDAIARTSGRTVRRPGKYHVNMDLNHGLERKEVEEDTSKGANTGGDIQAYGGVDSIVLRRQFVGWLAAFLRRHPVSKTCQHEFLELTAEFIKPLSLPMYTQMIAINPISLNNTTDIDEVTQSRLQMAVLNTLQSLEKIPVYHDALPTQQELQSFYVMRATKYGSIEDLAKTVTAVEALTRLLIREESLTDSAELGEAIQQGIDARMERCDSAIRKLRAKHSSDDATLTFIDHANSRLESLPRMMKVADG